MTIFKCHVLLYPIFEYLLDSNNIEYEITPTEIGVEISDVDKIYPGKYLEYSIPDEYKDIVNNIFPYQPYERLQIQAMLTSPNTETSVSLSGELIKYKDLKVTRIEVSNGSAQVRYFYNNVMGREYHVTMDYLIHKRDSIGNQPIRIKR